MSDAATQDLRSVETVMSVIAGRDENTGRRVEGALPETALALGVVTLILRMLRQPEGPFGLAPSA